MFKTYCLLPVRGLLYIPPYELRTYGQRAFSNAGLSAWNSFADHLKSQDLSISNFTFKRLLKTFLFEKCMQHIS